MTKNHHSDTIRALHECHDACLEAFSLHCMKAGGNHMAREHIRRMISCSELCQLTANFLLRHFPMMQDLCDLCAEICKQCAASCKGMHEPYMQHCVRACEEAARACINESYHLKSAAA